MFHRQEVHLISNPVCTKVTEINFDDFFYYDKDGFELNRAEQKFYRSMGYPIDYPILNHTCWQEPWFELESSVKGLILDHSMFLCRCSYAGEAQQQLESIKKSIPYADLLLKTKCKWGYDFALDAIINETIIEVLHVEFDHNDFDTFSRHMNDFEWSVKNIDWNDAANKIWSRRDQWQNLKGFDQNHWKANFLLGWSRAEYTEKSI